MSFVSESKQIAAFVLAGGQSSRMGRDKALALFCGKPLLQNALDILRSAGLPAKIAGSRSDLSGFAEVVPDSGPSSGPLSGIQAALSDSPAEWNLFLPVDMPLMSASMLIHLISRARVTAAPVTVTRLNGRMEPFPVVLHRSTLPLISQRLASGEAGCQATWNAIPAALGASLDSVHVEHLVQCGQCLHPALLPPIWWFQSANSPSELAVLNHICSKGTSKIA